jgi:hypothetical protein
MESTVQEWNVDYVGFGGIRRSGKTEAKQADRWVGTYFRAKLGQTLE